MPLGGTLKPTTVLHSSASKNRGREHFSMPTDGKIDPYLSVRIALGAIRGYQVVVRPLLTGSCRYLPTCSEYAAEAIATYGAFRGGWMSLKRVLRCHPFGGAGLDPVP
jgi:putative membrane protein insertion efficiency factor